MYLRYFGTIRYNRWHWNGTEMSQIHCFFDFKTWNKKCTYSEVNELSKQMKKILYPSILSILVVLWIFAPLCLLSLDRAFEGIFRSLLEICSKTERDDKFLHVPPWCHVKYPGIEVKLRHKRIVYVFNILRIFWRILYILNRLRNMP